MNLTDWKNIENTFYEYCLVYFDDLDGKTVAIKIPAPNIHVDETRLVEIIAGLFYVAVVFLIKLIVVKKTIARGQGFKPCWPERETTNDKEINTCKGTGIFQTVLTVCHSYINSFRRFIFAYRFT